MRPAFSVLFLTTLIGAGQGLLLALVSGQFYFVIGATPIRENGAFYAWGALIALALMGVGLVASFFHLAHPERGWRSIARWRSSWLSREVLLLPAAMAMTFLYGAVHFFGFDPTLVTFGNLKALDLSMAVGFLAAVVAVLLFVATGMIYACVRFIREWATPWTVINFILMGLASGYTLGAAYAAVMNSALTGLFTGTALFMTLAALLARGFTLLRNRNLKQPSTLRSAIGVHHDSIRQVTQGFMGGSFNTKEFVAPGGPGRVRALSFTFPWIAFVIPALLIAAGWAMGRDGLLAAAFVVQYAGLVVERWVFFAQGQHVQNLYYQRVA